MKFILFSKETKNINVEEYRNKKTVKKKLVLKKGIRSFINRLLIVTIIFLSCLILIKSNNSFKNILIKYVYEDSFKFTKLKAIYEKYFGKILSIDKVAPKEEAVFNEKLEYTKANVYNDGAVLTVSDNYMVPTLESGIVVFIGEKEGYGSTVIIEQVDGIDVWYSNIKANNIKMYDYIEKGSLIGEVKGKKLYMVFQKDGAFLDYKKYI